MQVLSEDKVTEYVCRFIKYKSPKNCNDLLQRRTEDYQRCINYNKHIQLMMTEILSVYFKGLMHVTDYAEQLGI
jgi:hypothetical protein